MKNESIPGTIEIWKEYRQLMYDLRWTRCSATCWNDPWERNAVDYHHIEYRFLKEGKWIRSYQHIDDEDWEDVYNFLPKLIDMVQEWRPENTILDMWWLASNSSLVLHEPIRKMKHGWDIQRHLNIFPVVIVGKQGEILQEL
jgi:hypothetical protein